MIPLGVGSDFVGQVRAADEGTCLARLSVSTPCYLLLGSTVPLMAALWSKVVPLTGPSFLSYLLISR